MLESKDNVECVYLDIKGIVHHEYLPVGYVVNQYFSRIFWSIQEELCIVRDRRLANEQVTTMEHPRYVPYLTSCDIFISENRVFHSRTHFDNVESIKIWYKDAYKQKL
jgi:hypothetical protein